jgi:hypothetical protein
MRLIRHGNEVINLDHMTRSKFSGSDLKLTVTMTDKSTEVFIGDLAVKVFAILCQQALNAEIPTSNPWKD